MAEKCAHGVMLMLFFLVFTMIAVPTGFSATTIDTSDYVTIEKGSLDDLKVQIAQSDKDMRLYFEQQIETLKRELVTNQDTNTKTVYEKLMVIEQELVFLTDPVRLNILLFLFVIIISSGFLWLYAAGKTKDWMYRRLYARKVLDHAKEKGELQLKINEYNAQIKEYEDAIRRQTLKNKELAELIRRMPAAEEKRPEPKEAAGKKKDVFSGEDGMVM
jgi:hypothetical protein